MHTRSILALLLALTFASTLLLQPAPARAVVYVEPLLQSALDAAAADTLLEAIVTYDPQLTTGSALTASLQQLGLGTITFKHFPVIAVHGSAGLLNQLSSFNGVRGLYANAQLDYYLNESVPAIEADRVWQKLGVTGSGIGIAVIDSGIDGRHPDLQFGTKLVQNVKFFSNAVDIGALYQQQGELVVPALYQENQENTDTGSGHGSHVASIAAGSRPEGTLYTGVAPGAQLIGLGAGEVLAVLWGLAAFDYAIEHAAAYNIKVINNSWGLTGKVASFDPLDPINQASKAATDKGIAVVFSAGNSGIDPLTGEPMDDTMNRYAMPDWVIAVAAGCKPDIRDDEYDQFDQAGCNDGSLAAFSGRGVEGGPRPTLTAPGVNIVAARAPLGVAIDANDAAFDLAVCGIPEDRLPDYTCSSGTSMAAPHVAGTIALMQERAGGRLEPARIKQILERTATPMKLRDSKQRYPVWQAGAGYLDAYKAVKGAR